MFVLHVDSAKIVNVSSSSGKKSVYVAHNMVDAAIVKLLNKKIKMDNIRIRLNELTLLFT